MLFLFARTGFYVPRMACGQGANFLQQGFACHLSNQSGEVFTLQATGLIQSIAIEVTTDSYMIQQASTLGFGMRGWIKTECPSNLKGLTVAKESKIILLFFAALSIFLGDTKKSFIAL